MTTRGVLFDFNGTLSNDEPIVFASYRSLFQAEWGWQLSREYYDETLLGRSDKEMIERVAAHLGHRPDVARLLDDRHLLYLAGISTRSPIRPKTVALIVELAARDVAVGIVSGAELRDIEHVLEVAGIRGQISCIVAQDHVARPKPHPESYQIGLQRLRRSALETIAFEDSIVGIRSAQRAGLRCVGVEGSEPSARLIEAADSVVDHLSIEVLDAARLLDKVAPRERPARPYGQAAPQS